MSRTSGCMSSDNRAGVCCQNKIDMLIWRTSFLPVLLNSFLIWDCAALERTRDPNTAVKTRLREANGRICCSPSVPGCSSLHHWRLVVVCWAASLTPGPSAWGRTPATRHRGKKKKKKDVRTGDTLQACSDPYTAIYIKPARACAHTVGNCDSWLYVGVVDECYSVSLTVIDEHSQSDPEHLD